MQTPDLATSQPTPTATRPAGLNLQRVLAVLPLVLTLGVFALFLTVYFAYAWNLFKFPFDYDQGEGFELYDAIRLARGQNFYLDNAVFPFYSGNYPPVYRTLLVPFIWLIGPKLYVGRVLAFACSLVVGALIIVAARALWKRQPEAATRFRAAAWLIPIIVGLAFFAANYVYHVAPLARAHLPMVMFALAGIYCLDRAFDAGVRPNRQWVWAGLGVALLMTAGLTKLQAIDALAAGFAFLLLRRPKWFAVGLLACLAFTAVFVLVMQAATQGQFWLNVVAANVNDYDIEVTWRTYYQWFALQGALIVCSVIYVIWDGVAAIRARSFRPITIWSLYFIAGSALGMLTGKWGAGPSYLIAAIAASCVCTAGLFARLTGDGAVQTPTSAVPRRRTVLSVLRLPSSVSVLFAVIMLIQAKSNIHLPVTGRFFGPIAQVLGVANAESVYPPYPYYDTIGYTQLGHFVDPADIANGWDLVNTLANVQGPVWSEEAMLTLWAGKDVVTNPTQLLNLSKNNMLDTREMIGMIRAKAFGAVVFRAQFYPKDVKQALVENYYWAKMVRMNGFEYWVLLPNQGQ